MAVVVAVVVVAVVVAVAVAVAAVALPHRELAPVGHLFVLQSVAINSIGKPQKPNPGRAADDRRIAALEQKNLTSHHSSGRVSPCPSGASTHFHFFQSNAKSPQALIHSL